MRRLPGWLSGVRNILSAETGDLRELAKLAGEDPRTLYIGTSIDGIDIRGQDLRGMIFTTIASDKPLIDKSTKIDYTELTPDVSSDDEPPASERIYASVLISDAEDVFYLEDEYIRDGIKFFSMARFDDFLEFSKFPGPSFVLFRLDRRFNLRIPPHILGLAVRSSGRPSLSRDETFSLESYRAPVVVLQRPPNGSYRRSIVGDVLDAARVIGINYADIRHYLTSEDVLLYARAGRYGSSSPIDAIVQIYLKLRRLGVSDRRGTLILRHPRNGLTETFISMLFPDFDVLEPTHLGGRALPDVSTVAFSRLSDLATTTRNNTSDYRHVLESILEINGWTIEDQVRNQFDIVAQYRGLRHTIHIDTETTGPTLYPSRRFGYAVPQIENLNNFRISEQFNYTRTLEFILDRGELLISIRDIAEFYPETGTVWNLIAIQLQRLRGGSPSQARTEYLAFLLRAASFRDGHHPEIDEIVERPDVADQVSIVLVSARYENGVGIYSARIEPNKRNRSPAREVGRRAWRVAFTIDGDGPNLRHIAPTWFGASIPESAA